MLLLALALGAPLAFAEGPMDFTVVQAFHGEGILNRVDPGTGIVNLTHGPVSIANWQTMTRDLRLKPKTLARGLVPGMHVRFRLQAEDGLHYAIIAVKPVSAR